MTRRNWTIQETRAAFALYLLLEPSQIDKRNSDIIALAKALDRTPSAVALELWNIAANDAKRVESGRVGMSHGSKLDKETKKSGLRTTAKEISWLANHSTSSTRPPLIPTRSLTPSDPSSTT